MILFVFFGNICIVFAVLILFVFFGKVCGPARVQQVQIVRLAHPLHCWSASPVDKQIPEFHFDNHVHCSPTEMQHDQLQVFVEILQKVQRTRGIEPLNFIFSSYSCRRLISSVGAGDSFKILTKLQLKNLDQNYSNWFSSAKFC